MDPATATVMKTGTNATDPAAAGADADDPATAPDAVLHLGERTIMAIVLALIALLAGIDLLVDLRDGVSAWHVLAEAALAAAACFGVFHLLRGAWRLRRRLQAQARDFSAFRQQAEQWRAGSKMYLDGLSRSIGLQLDQWQLSAAEKEVAFLLLKGLSLREIAAARRTSEKTARVQSSAVYAKSGLAGRSELSAFFLEDLLPPARAPAGDEPGGPRAP